MDSNEDGRDFLNTSMWIKKVTVEGEKFGATYELLVAGPNHFGGGIERNIP
jgi:hypothetical protein